MIHANALSQPLFQVHNGLVKATFLEASQLEAFSQSHHILSATHFVAAPLERTVDWPEILLVTPILDGKKMVEVWYTDAPVQYVQVDGLRLAFTDDLVMGVGSFEDCQDNLEARSYETYDRIFKTCTARNYPNMVRMWNYIPHINEPDSHGMERYQTFCKGRARAFFDQGYEENFLPAGTGIGCRSPRLSIAFLAFREQGCVNLENPLQTPAYHYPKQYGPKSPSFARGTWLKHSGELLVSGTSSIIGHQTVHEGDVVKQFNTSLDNINRLIDPQNLEKYDLVGGGTVADLTLLKVYVRDVADLATIQAICAEKLDPQQPVLYLHADICRADLAVELEGCLPAQERDA